MRKFEIVLGVFILLLLTGLAGLLAVSQVPRRGPPNVAIALLGYTNDSSGTRVARIGVTNLSGLKVLVYLPTVQVQAPADPLGFTDYYPGNTNQWRQFQAMLGEGESGSFTISPPPLSSQSPWRISFFVYCDYELVQRIKNVVSRRQHPYSIKSAWMTNDTPESPTAN